MLMVMVVVPFGFCCCCCCCCCLFWSFGCWGGCCGCWVAAGGDGSWWWWWGWWDGVRGRPLCGDGGTSGPCCRPAVVVCCCRSCRPITAALFMSGCYAVLRRRRSGVRGGARPPPLPPPLGPIDDEMPDIARRWRTRRQHTRTTGWGGEEGCRAPLGGRQSSALADLRQ